MGIFVVAFCSVFSCLPSYDRCVAFGGGAGITEGNSFGAPAWYGFVECCLLVRGGGLIAGAVFSASAYPVRLVFCGVDLAVSWLIRFRAPPFGLFDLCQTRVGEFYQR